MNAVPTSDPGKLHVTFEIEDTGEGIAAGDQAAIFEAFVQTKAAKRHEGVGLGLTISRQIIELMGGKISGGKYDRPGNTVFCGDPMRTGAGVGTTSRFRSGTSQGACRWTAGIPCLDCGRPVRKFDRIGTAAGECGVSSARSRERQAGNKKNSSPRSSSGWTANAGDGRCRCDPAHSGM